MTPDIGLLSCEHEKGAFYLQLRTGPCQPIPRHREIKDYLARHILRKLKD